jgi:hypothetical protein
MPLPISHATIIRQNTRRKKPPGSIRRLAGSRIFPPISSCRLSYYINFADQVYPSAKSSDFGGDGRGQKPYRNYRPHRFQKTVRSYLTYISSNRSAENTTLPGFVFSSKPLPAGCVHHRHCCDVDDVPYIITGLQHVDGCPNPQQDRTDRLCITQPCQQLVGDICRLKRWEN